MTTLAIRLNPSRRAAHMASEQPYLSLPFTANPPPPPLADIKRQIHEEAEEIDRDTERCRRELDVLRRVRERHGCDDRNPS